mmetsp:Transcript_16347/g.26609  ORF Transcript_16347/g.26609 Transcript_16347/m.26609 type:complete len:549 (-) Transcript_16347:931-2577(-)
MFSNAEEHYERSAQAQYDNGFSSIEDEAGNMMMAEDDGEHISLVVEETRHVQKSNLVVARRLLYITHFGNQMSELVWQFCLTIWLAQLTEYKSLLLVSTYGVALQLIVCLATPVLGRFIDDMAKNGKRSMMAIRLIAAENMCVLLATLSCAYLLGRTGTLNLTQQNDDQAHTQSSYFSEGSFWQDPLALVLLGTIHFLGGSAQALDKSFLVAVERDWIVVMASKNASREAEEGWLSATNVVLKQIDLSCQILAPAISGWVLTLLPPTFGIVWVGLWNCLALLVEGLSVHVIGSRLVPELNSTGFDLEPNPNDDVEGEGGHLLEDDGNNSNCMSGWKSLQLYFAQSVVFAGLGLALLYFNVLTFSGMMTAFLVSKGMSLSSIGMWRGFASTVGLLATCIYNQSTKHFSLQFTALWSIIWEFLCLSLTFASVFSTSTQVKLALLIGGVLPSRIGLWVYDIAVTQLYQQSVAETVRGQVGGTQMSLNAFMELLPYGLAIVCHKPEQFSILISGGYFAVGLAMLLYGFGFYMPYQRRRTLCEKESSSEFQMV